MDKLVKVAVAGKMVEIVACCLNCGAFYQCSRIGLDDRVRVARCLPEHKLWKE
jgi:hypothetical protein